MEHRLFTIQTRTDLERCYLVIKELRPHLSFDEFISVYDESHSSDGYELVAIEEGEKIVAVMGYRFLSDFVRGRHLYIDDLVSAGSARSRGLGAELLNFAETVCRQSGLSSLRLCTGIENERGVNFYERNGWTKRAFAYAKKLK